MALQITCRPYRNGNSAIPRDYSKSHGFKNNWLEFIIQQILNYLAILRRYLSDHKKQLHIQQK